VRMAVPSVLSASVRRVLVPLELVGVVVRVMRIAGAGRRMAHPPSVAVPQRISLRSYACSL